MAGILGYCEECHRVRWLARVRTWAGSPMGVCTQCEREAEEARKARADKAREARGKGTR